MASIYDKHILSKADLERIENLNEAWKSETDKKTKDGIHAQAEAIRNSYGYSGGDDGSQFIVNNASVMNTASATKGYTDALQGVKDAQAESFSNEAARIEKESADRLREAYIKNMQDSLGLSQRLKSAGISGGATESTVAYMNNVYNDSRNDIRNDTDDRMADLESDKISALAKAQGDIAKAEYDGALKRADTLQNAEKTAYERAQNEREFEFKKSTDERDFEYQKSIDTRDFEYQKEQDELARKTALAKAASSGSSSSSSSSSSSGTKLSVSNVISLMKSGIYNPAFAEILGITDDEVRDMIDDYNGEAAKAAAWKIMGSGIYDESFSEIVGFSEEVLRDYVDNILNGYG